MTEIIHSKQDEDMVCRENLQLVTKGTHETSSSWLKGEPMMKKQYKPGHQKRCPTLIMGRSKYNTNRYCLCCKEITMFQYIVQYGHSRCSKCGGGYAQRTKEGKKNGNDVKPKL